MERWLKYANTIPQQRAGRVILGAHFLCVWTFTKQVLIHICAPPHVLQRNLVQRLHTMHLRRSPGLRLLK